MADNVAITQGSGTNIATDDIGGVHFQRVKLAVGGDGVAQDFTFGVKDNTGSISITPSSDHGPFKTKPVTAAHDVVQTITRPNNANLYAAMDVIGGPIQFSGVGANGESVVITGVQLELDISAIPAGMTTFKLALYSATPPSNIADNGTFTLPSGDRATFLGFIDIPAPVSYGGTCYAEVNNVNKQVDLATSSLFAYLVSVGTFTPAGNSEVYKATLHTLEI